jgi:hypothetical protein
MMLGAIVGSGAPGGAAPIYLTSERVDGGIRFQVIGTASTRYDASFLLEVNGSGNHSRHQGSAILQRGDRVTLSTVTVGVPPNAKWQARLRVEPTGSSPYEQILASD